MSETKDNNCDVFLDDRIKIRRDLCMCLCSILFGKELHQEMLSDAEKKNAKPIFSTILRRNEKLCVMKLTLAQTCLIKVMWTFLSHLAAEPICRKNPKGYLKGDNWHVRDVVRRQIIIVHRLNFHYPFTLLSCISVRCFHPARSALGS